MLDKYIIYKYNLIVLKKESRRFHFSPDNE